MIYFSGSEGGWHVGVMELTHGHEFFFDVVVVDVVVKGGGC